MVDVGTNSSDSVDYPVYALRVARAVGDGQADRGILCAAAVSVCAWRPPGPGVRAVKAHEPFEARISRRHNDSNILCLGSRFTGVTWPWRLCVNGLKSLLKAAAMKADRSDRYPADFINIAAYRIAFHLLRFYRPSFTERGFKMTFQELIFALNKFWAGRGCVIQQPYDLEVGAGTFNPSTFLRVLGPEPYSVAYVAPSRHPTDGRDGENPNRLQHYYQYQVILKPSPEDSQEIFLESLKSFGVDPLDHDIRFVKMTGNPLHLGLPAWVGKSGWMEWK